MEIDSNRASSAVQHDQQHLAPVHEWMADGAENAINTGKPDLDGLLPSPGLCLAPDTGFGMHRVPLARAGFDVIAIDASAHFISRAKALSDGLKVTAVRDDLPAFPNHVPPVANASLILCMGDTLTHLDRMETLAGT